MADLSSSPGNYRSTQLNDSFFTNINYSGVANALHRNITITELSISSMEKALLLSIV